MRVVQQRLVGQGLDRYKPLVRFNRNLIWISLGCDFMIIGLMSLPNSFVYMQVSSCKSFVAKREVDAFTSAR